MLSRFKERKEQNMGQEKSIKKKKVGRERVR